MPRARPAYAHAPRRSPAPPLGCHRARLPRQLTSKPAISARSICIRSRQRALLRQARYVIEGNQPATIRIATRSASSCTSLRMCEASSMVLPAAWRLAHERLKDRNTRRIEVGGRLVKHQDRRVGQQRLGQAKPLERAARQHSSRSVGRLCQPQQPDASVMRAGDRRGSGPERPDSRRRSGSDRAPRAVAGSRSGAEPRSHRAARRGHPRAQFPTSAEPNHSSVRISVVLPAPFGPTSASISPRPTAIERSSTARTLP